MSNERVFNVYMSCRLNDVSVQNVVDLLSRQLLVFSSDRLGVRSSLFNQKQP